MQATWRQLIILVVALIAFVGNSFASDTGGRYRADYAQDFAKCRKHFAQGVPPLVMFDPSGKEQYPLCFLGFATLYSGVSKTAIYSANHLTKTSIAKARELKREDSFRAENRLPKQLQVQNSDYKGQGYDRGHLVPNGDMPDKKRQYDSFSFANIVPQHQDHNRGVWRMIESHTRTLASRYGEAYVVTGVVFAGKVTTMNGVAVPSHFYKAVYLPTQNLSAVYYSANNNTASYDLIDTQELQNRTGVQAFPAINARFVPEEFVLDSRNDKSGAKSSKTPEQSDNIWYWIGRIIVAIWQAIGG